MEMTLMDTLIVSTNYGCDVPTSGYTRYKNKEQLHQGTSRRVQGKVTTSKPATIHEGFIMASWFRWIKRIRSKATKKKRKKISESNKKKLGNQKRSQHNTTATPTTHQQNRRQEAAKAYVAAQLKGKIILGIYRYETNAAAS
ncbi:hypothetical protein Tco_0468028 [Tanacetum coccineum]